MCFDRCENWGAIILAPRAQRCRKSGRAHAKAADTEVGLALSYKKGQALNAAYATLEQQQIKEDGRSAPREAGGGDCCGPEGDDAGEVEAERGAGSGGHRRRSGRENGFL